MIVLSMSYKEIYDQLAADKEKVDWRKDYYYKKAIRELRKATSFPAYQCFDYESPNKNHYVISYFASDRHHIDQPIMGSFLVLYDNRKRYVVKWGAGGYQHTEESQIAFIRQIQVYTQHFFDRYKNRFIKKDLSSNDIACHFFSRNQHAIPIQIDNRINYNIDKYGNNAKQGIRVRDGFCFTKVGLEGRSSEDGDRLKDKINALCVLYTTFMREEDMKEMQQNAIKMEQRVEMLRFQSSIRKQFPDGMISFTLEH